MKKELQIRFGDIDRLGHVNNAVYAQFFDIGRVEFLQRYMPGLRFDGRTLVLVHLETDFIRPVFEHDRIAVETYMERIGGKSIAMMQEIRDEAGVLRARCRSVLSTLDMTAGGSFPIPAEWRAVLERAEFVPEQNVDSLKTQGHAE
ncbi:MAG: acyl-CoA thioesterase [Bacteroidales bacterium]|nr:acyl-CoA thioesterase [Bacteroidales bacterium]